jgi:hypothetical protein
MSLVAAPRTARGFADVGASVRAATRADVAAGALVAVVTLVLTAVAWRTWGDLGVDTGFDQLAGARIAGGELPYVDFDYWYGPFPAFLVGGLSALAGPGFDASIGLGLVLAFTAIGLTYRLARTLVAPWPAALAAILTAAAALGASNTSYVLPHATSAPLGVVLALAALLLLVRHARSPRALRWPALAGVICGLVALTRPELALPLYAATATWLAARVVLAGHDRAIASRAAGATAAGAVLLPLAVYAVFAVAVGLDDLLFSNLYPRDFVDEAGHVILAQHAPLTLGSFAALAGKAALAAGALGALMAGTLAVGRGGRARVLVLAAVAIAAIAFLAVLAARPETVRHYLQYAYGWIPLGALAAVALAAWRLRRTDAGLDTQVALLLALVVAATAANVYAQYTPFPKAEFADPTAYLMPFAAPFVAWALTAAAVVRGRTTHALGTAALALLAAASVALASGDARDETITVRGPGGSLQVAPADGALRDAMDVIARESRPGDPILLAPQLSGLYVLADRSDPLRQLSLLPGSLGTAREEDDAIARMSDVRLAIVDTTPLDIYEHGAFGETFATRLGSWLRADFRRVATLRGTGDGARALDVFIRRSP